MVIEASGVEANNSLGVEEWYHTPLQRALNGICLDDPDLSDELTLRLALKSVTDTMGPDGLFPILIAYGRLPQYPAHEAHPRQSYRKKTVAVGLSDEVQASCEPRINTTLSCHLLPSARMIIRPIDKVRVFPEKFRRCKGPYSATQIVRNAVRVSDGMKVKYFPL